MTSDSKKPYSKILMASLEAPHLTGPPVKLLHTSDWHLGKFLLRMKNRNGELNSFFTWLLDILKEEKIDTLLVAGDIFDVYSPSNQSQELYYNFLVNLSRSSLRDIVITSGNHDSSDFLKAPAELLKLLNINVVSEIPENLENELITLSSPELGNYLLVAAVPFLKESELRTTQEGETISERDKLINKATKDHYHQLAELAQKKRLELQKPTLPIVAMGHLHPDGGTTADGDGTREAYIGASVRIGAAAFPETFDYVALGHMHSPQQFKRCNIRFSGAPLQMTFNEAGKPKSVTLVTLGEGKILIETLNIPIFQELVKISGDIDEIRGQINALIQKNSKAWLEIIYTGTSAQNVRALFEDMIKGSELEILTFPNKTALNELLKNHSTITEISELVPQEVFRSFLKTLEVPAEEWDELELAFSEILLAIEESAREQEVSLFTTHTLF